MNGAHCGKALVAVVVCCLGASAATACGSSSGSGGGSEAGTNDVTTDEAQPIDGPGVDSADAMSSDGRADADATTADALDADVGQGDTGQGDTSEGDTGTTESGSGDADASAASGDAEGGASEDAPFDGEAGPVSLCPGSSFLFCDGFEQDLTNWTAIDSTGGNVTVDSVHVYRGAKAMHASIDAIADAGVSAAAMAQEYGPQPWPTHFFTRFFAYVPSAAPPSTAGLLDLIQNGAPYAGTELRLVPPNAALGMQTYATDAGLVTWQSATASSALDQWVCFEVEVDTTAETEHVYMNDTEVTDLTRSALALPQLGNVSVGLSFFEANAQGAVDTWIDEVAVDSTRIGCAN